MQRGSRGLPFLVLCSFYKQNVWVLLQRAHVASISKSVVIVGEGSSRLIVFSNVPPFALFHMLLAPRGFEYLICSCSPWGLPHWWICKFLTRLMERGYTWLRVGYFVNPPNPCNFMVLMEGGLYLTEEWVMHFVNPPYPCNFMGLIPRQKKKGFFPKCFINSQQSIPPPPKKKP